MSSLELSIFVDEIREMDEIISEILRGRTFQDFLPHTFLLPNEGPLATEKVEFLGPWQVTCTVIRNVRPRKDLGNNLLPVLSADKIPINHHWFGISKETALSQSLVA